MTALVHAQHAAPAANGVFGRISTAFQRVQENRARAAIYRQTLRELNDLTNRDLADLGISRADIPSIARDAAWGATK